MPPILIAQRSQAVVFIRRLDFVAAVVACTVMLAALAIIWVARLSLGRDVYVSVMGADSMPTAEWFKVALVLVSIGGGLTAYTTRGIQVAPWALRWWRPSISLGLAGGFFLLASQVTCTPGCPVPYGPQFTWPDFIHTTAAVLAFAFACWAMAQLSFAPGRRAMAALSLGSGVAVALIAGAGGIMSLARWETDLGSRFEFAATTIAILWLISVGWVNAAQNSPLPGFPTGMDVFRRRALARRSARRRGFGGARLTPLRVDARDRAAPQ